MQNHSLGGIHGVIIPLDISRCRMSVILYPPCYNLKKRGQVKERIVFSVTERLMLKMVLQTTNYRRYGQAKCLNKILGIHSQNKGKKRTQKYYFFYK